jgi:hypothetical protein
MLSPNTSNILTLFDNGSYSFKYHVKYNTHKRIKAFLLKQVTIYTELKSLSFNIHII